MIVVVFPKRSALIPGLMALLLLPLTSCAGGPLGQALQQSLSPDPQLRNNPVSFGTGNNSSQPVSQTESSELPGQIPVYANARLLTPTGDALMASQGVGGVSRVFRWQSPDRIEQVLEFYRRELQRNGWQLSSQPNDDLQGAFQARQNDLLVSVTVQPGAQGGTEFAIRYVRSAPVAQSPTPQPDVSPSPVENSDPNFIGPRLPDGSTGSIAQSLPPTDPNQFSDLEKVPQDLRSSVSDLAQLGVLSLTTPGSKTSTSNPAQFDPNKAVSRREFARWLVAANNRLYATNPAKQVRPAAETAQPAFQDVPRTDPDFAAIQGLAEAGLIPSPLSGDSTTVLFRPDAPLTRENLLLWKVPLDTRQALPNATIEAVKETWGFQDTSKIDPRAMRAALADFQNGDQANIRRVFGFTTLFQPKRTVTRAEAAAALWYFGYQGEGVSAQDALRTPQVGQQASGQQTSGQGQ